MKAFASLLCIAEALRSNKQNLEGLWGTDGDGTEYFRLVTNLRRFRVLIRYILE